MRIVTALLAALALSLAAAPAAAVPPDSEGGRFIVRNFDDGILRIDRETGATSVCREDAGGWACRAVPDDREALEDEISRLTTENTALARRVGELEDRLAAANGEDPAAPGDDAMSDLPSDAEIDRIMETFETMMRRFLGMIRSLKEDFEADRT